ncbi:MAG: molecular chaperone HtpG [Candidatus Muirbacterium halophilum]|nr:molecular chaperone HtpG [Candidatus Muirbacterium halophilum]MCK9477235.1 molecular chaperone HtpG [Candidatus Muirbacterium halophilum]
MSKQMEKQHKEFKFQAETNKMLDIVIHSLYTDKSIFLRELVSNASDALEKMRYISLTQNDYTDKEIGFNINIELDEKSNKVIIKDTGIGMNFDELKKNLGTIAHSGALEYLSKVKNEKDLQLIGQFGVGFYSAFMVADKVIVKTRSYQKDSKTYKWESDGKTSYTIDETDVLPRGTQIEIFLKEDNKDFTNDYTVKDIIKKHSSFIAFPVFVGEEKINTVEALWTKNTSEVTTEQYNEFYKFISNDFQEPMFNIHFSTDAPISINSILFLPESNVEKLGFRGLEDSEVGLYCKKILIEPKAKNILPKWLRFVKGVVDSEDLPLNISRETLQDSTLITKIRNILTRKVIKFLEEQSKKDKEKFEKFYKEFSVFIKEGIVTDFERKNDLTTLLRYETLNNKELTSFDQYIENMKEGQEEIYFITGSNHNSLKASPYIEVFAKKGLDVIFAYEPVDDFVFQHFTEYKGKKIVSVDSAKLDLDEKKTEGIADIEALAKWMKDEVLKDKVKEVKISNRLVDSPAILVSEGMTQGMQRFMQAMNQSGQGSEMPTGLNDLEINSDNEIIKKLTTLRNTNKKLAEEITEQLFDNAAILAGLTTDFKSLVTRMNKIIETAIK